MNYSKVRAGYCAIVFRIIREYFKSSETDISSYRQHMEKVTTAAYIAATKSKDEHWLRVKIVLILLFIAKLWDDFQSIKRDKQFTEDEIDNIALMHANNYTRGLDGIWGIAAVIRAKDIMLTFQGIDGKPPEFPCVTCDSLRGQTHPAQWWVDRDLVPYQGNQNYACGCWGCKHGLFDSKGRQYTL